jgi:hypothetical protein
MQLNIFLLIGQSNMAGRGALNDVEPIFNPDIYMYRDDKWQAAKEPLHVDKPEIAGVGLAMSFAGHIIESSLLKPIGLLPCAFGGTVLEKWMPGTDLYNNAVSTTKRALSSGVLKGILWHQGEGDSKREHTAKTYSKRFQTMITSLRGELNAAEVPVVTGELGYFLQNYEGLDYWQTVNSQLHKAKKSLKFYSCACAEGLDDKGDNLHFNSESLRLFGVRYADEYIKLINTMQ